jgi:putative SOS response-associated peptidase YedK
LAGDLFDGVRVVDHVDVLLAEILAESRSEIGSGIRSFRAAGTRAGKEQPGPSPPSPPKSAEPVESCAILTTTANEATRHLHERMPIILDREHYGAWLDPLTPPPTLHELLRPCPPERIALHPVGAAVGNVRNDGAELVAPTADLFTA